MTSPTNNIKFNVKNGLAVGASGFGVIDDQGNWIGASGAGQSPYGATGAQGQTGATGPTGDAGDTGIQGASGSQGQTGATGGFGVQGENGQQGLTGATGSQGPQGDQGVTGDAGQQGATGSQGEDGASGVQGATGSQGIQGVDGASGIDGASGVTGEDGATGPSGLRFKTTSSTTFTLGTGGNQTVYTADTGLNYSVGQPIILVDGGGDHQHGTVVSYNSSTGELVFTKDVHVGSGSRSSWTINVAGSPGPEGASGATGVVGATGETGATGSEGPQGDQGIQGASGADGDQGPDGATGYAGATGSEGSQGDIGNDGYTGDNGEHGDRGQTGEDGATGIEGPQGPTGESGATGVDGATGSQGIQGGDGSGTGGGYADGDSSGYPTLTYSAPANSTSLAFAGGNEPISTDFYTNGWPSVTSELNGGASYYEYIYLSYKQNYSTVTNDTAIATNNGGYYAWVYNIESLNGTSNPPALENGWGAQNSYGGTLGFTNIDIYTDEVAVITSGVENNQYATIASISGGGLTWTKRTDYLFSGGNNGPQINEIWYAVNNTGNNIFSAPITITYADSYDDAAAILSTWSGVNLSNIWVGGSGGPTNTGYTGEDGATGPEGNQGYTGATGSQGIDGATGAEGAQGPMGDPGVDGATGATGTAGEDGATGPDGATGFQGNTGWIGPDGATGPTGSTGPQGTSGPTGEDGATGAPGSHGLRYRTTTSTTVDMGSASGNILIQLNSDAYIGYDYSYSVGQDVVVGIDHFNYLVGKVTSYNTSTGELYLDVLQTYGTAIGNAYVNLNGAVGQIGASGATGLTGATGWTGDDGSTGLTGDDGATGIQGASGADGDQGPDGATGPTGDDGATGIVGDDGATGATGDDGVAGPTGDVGATGYTGATGITSLSTGATGLSGTSQTTIDAFATNNLGTVKYLIQGVDDAGNVQVTELIFTHNSAGVYITEYATLNLAVGGGEFDFNGDLMSLSGTEDLSTGSGTVDLMV